MKRPFKVCDKCGFRIVKFGDGLKTTSGEGIECAICEEKDVKYFRGKYRMLAEVEKIGEQEHEGRRTSRWTVVTVIEQPRQGKSAE